MMMTKHAIDLEHAFAVYPAARLDTLKVGDTVLIDDGFTCQRAGAHTVRADDGLHLYFECGEGRHYLEGQLCEDGTLAGIVVLPSVTKGA